MRKTKAFSRRINVGHKASNDKRTKVFFDNYVLIDVTTAQLFCFGIWRNFLPEFSNDDEIYELGH